MEKSIQATFANLNRHIPTIENYLINCCYRNQIEIQIIKSVGKKLLSDHKIMQT